MCQQGEEQRNLPVQQSLDKQVAPLWTSDGNTWKLFKITKPWHREPARYYQKITSEFYYLNGAGCPGDQAGNSESPWQNPASRCAQPRVCWDILPTLTALQRAPSSLTHHWVRRVFISFGCQAGITFLSLCWEGIIDRAFHYLKRGLRNLLQVRSVAAAVTVTSASANSQRP